MGVHQEAASPVLLPPAPLAWLQPVPGGEQDSGLCCDFGRGAAGVLVLALSITRGWKAQVDVGSGHPCPSSSLPQLSFVSFLVQSSVG